LGKRKKKNFGFNSKTDKELEEFWSQGKVIVAPGAKKKSIWGLLPKHAFSLGVTRFCIRVSGKKKAHQFRYWNRFGCYLPYVTELGLHGGKIGLTGPKRPGFFNIFPLLPAGSLKKWHPGGKFITGILVFFFGKTNFFPSELSKGPNF